MAVPCSRCLEQISGSILQECLNTPHHIRNCRPIRSENILCLRWNTNYFRPVFVLIGWNVRFELPLRWWGAWFTPRWQWKAIQIEALHKDVPVCGYRQWERPRDVLSESYWGSRLIFSSLIAPPYTSLYVVSTLRLFIRGKHDVVVVLFGFLCKVVGF